MNNELQHIALIPDGNRRWAQAHKLPVLAGHQQVVEKVFPELIKKALSLKIKYFTIWGFSTENWQRSGEEVEGLFGLIELFFEKFGSSLNAQNVRIAFLGRRDNLDLRYASIIERWEEKTKENDGLLLNFAVNYGGRDEIVRAINKIIAQNELTEVGEDNFGNYLDTSINDLPDPDLIIRTSGEKRLSGFMSWQSAYSELYFSDKMMPDWTGVDLEEAVDDYYSRQRRYGK